VVVAGGGGGAGGAAGGNAGSDGCCAANGGKAGSTSAGGAGGAAGPGPINVTCTDAGNPGSLGQGGAAGYYDGGGGGGYYGGGGGGGGCGNNYFTDYGGGGGGSSYVVPGASNVIFELDKTRTPQITITAPVGALSALHVSPSKFKLSGRRVGGRCMAASRHTRERPRCTRSIALQITYQLTQPATVTFTLTRSIPGRKVNGHCRKPTHANRHKPRCARVTSVPGSLTQAGNTGANTLLFTGRIGGRHLAPADYRLTATPSSSTGTGQAQTATFRIVR
jgi:hypothetical protein